MTLPGSVLIQLKGLGIRNLGASSVTHDKPDTHLYLQTQSVELNNYKVIYIEI